MEDIAEIADNSGIDNTISKISSLSDEILSHIFAFLPLADRKHVRLVSRICYNCSICVDITKREKFVFRPGFSIEDINDVMLRSNYPLMHFEFHSLPVCDLPIDLWRVCGQRIRTLEFSKCQWNDKILSDIILHCENLTSFVLRVCSHRAEPTLWGLLCSERSLVDLISNGIRRPTVNTFFIFLDSIHPLDESVLHKIFILCPSIKRFSVATTFNSATFTCSLMSYFVESSILRELNQFLNSVQQFSFDRTVTWMETLIEKAEQLRLEQFSSLLSYGRSLLQHTTVLDFFKSQKIIEVIGLNVKGDAEPICELFFHILESCPNLKEYRFCRAQPDKVVFSAAELRRFVTAISKLKFLSLNFAAVNKPVPAYHDILSNSAHLNLTSFEWLHNDIDSDFFAAFIQRCSLLRHLKLNKCCDTMLQTIFQYLVELCTLVVLYGEECTDFGFTGHDVNGEENGYSMKRLQQLKHLELLYNFEDVHMEKVAFELHLPPRLEFLSLGQVFYLQLSEEDSSHVASHLSELRVLAIHESLSGEYSTEKTVQFCQRLKNLHRLICCEAVEYESGPDDCPYRIHKNLVRSFFNACSSLRYISDRAFRTYVRNPFTGKILCERTENLDLPGHIFEHKSF